MKELFNLGDHTKMVISILIIFILFIVFYIIKNFRTIDFQLKIILLIIIIGFLAGILLSKKQDKNFELLKNNFYLTTGSIEEYIVPNLKGYRGNTSNSIKYIYKAGNQFIKNSYIESYFIAIPNKKPDLSILYLVIYEKTNPKNSFILLNYPITSPEDFERYKEMFKDKIPANAFKQD